MVESNYRDAFQRIQKHTVAVTTAVARSLVAGMSELEISEKLASELAAVGLNDHWYPILISAGSNSGKPLSRRFHLPSADALVRADDIVIVDSTPLDRTVWGNWSITVSIGNDPFFAALARDCDEIAEKTHDFARTARTIGEVYDVCMQLMSQYQLTSLDPRDDVGHSIFQVPEGQRVEDTPLSQRLFISEEYRNEPLRGILSIEPQVGRAHPRDGITYGAKQQRVLICPSSTRT
jgi:Xaa-Pro aminopeptidase